MVGTRVLGFQVLCFIDLGCRAEDMRVKVNGLRFRALNFQCRA